MQLLSLMLARDDNPELSSPIRLLLSDMVIPRGSSPQPAGQLPLLGPG
jgi:hypothetical protein